MIIETVEVPDNPFPGLRPFQFQESKLFFGRRELSEELLSRLSETRFLAVVGTSGSGKSSLVRAGLLPALCGGLMGEAGSDWRVAVLRPGSNPIGELVRVLNDPSVLGLSIDENEEAQQIIIESTLRRGSLGLVEIVRQAELPPDENLLIVVDQFEELFRYEDTSSRAPYVKSGLTSASKAEPMSEPESSNNGKGLQPSSAEKYANEAAAFVKLLLEATRQDRVPIFVVITMRSEYLGDCARFRGLPEAINEGQYLVPRLTREQQRQAITGPIRIYNAEITPRLVNQLLNDMGDDADQLPLLQHALMRTWKKAGSDSASQKSLDLNHYEEIGGMAKALSKHADVAYDELSDKQKKIAEKLFKCLTLKSQKGREIRRPTTLKDICEIIDEKEKDVVEVIEVFRRRGRSFLMPPESEPLKPDSQIDISHESLIRCWERLTKWVEEESKSAGTYVRLADTAMLHKQGLAELLRDPEAHFTLEWWKLNNPNEAWAKRYHRDADFMAVKDFLEKSRKQRDKEEAGKEKQQRKEHWRKFERVLTVTFIVAFLAVAIAAIGFFGQFKRAEQESTAAKQQRTTAEHRSYAAQLAVAQMSLESRDYASTIKKLDSIKATLKDDFDSIAGFEWYLLWRLAHTQNEKTTFDVHRGRPVYAVAFSPDGQRVATGGDDGIVRLWDINSKQVIPVPVSNSPTVSAVMSIAFSRSGKKLATASADGSIRIWDTDKLITLNTDKVTTLNEPNPKLKMAFGVAFSRDEKMLAATGAILTEKGEEGTVSVWRLDTGEKIVKGKKVHQILAGPNKKPTDQDPHAIATSIAFSPGDEKILAIGTNDGVELWSATGDDLTKKISKESVVLPTVYVSSVAFSRDGKMLAISSKDSKLRLWDMSKTEAIELAAHLKEISSVVFSESGDRLATGSYDGSVRLWDTSNSPSGLELINKQPKVKLGSPVSEQKKGNQPNQFLALRPTLKGHSDYVNSIAFSHDGATLVSGSHDGTAKLWETDKTWQDINEPEPLGLKLKAHTNAILSLAFIPTGDFADGTTVVTGSADMSMNLFYIRQFMRERRDEVERSPEKLMELFKSHSQPYVYQDEVSSIAVSNSGKLLAAGYWGGKVRLWAIEPGKVLREMKLSLPPPASGKILSISFSSDDKMLAASDDRATVKIWQLESGELHSRSESMGYFLAFSPTDGNLLATGGADNTVKLWNPKTGALLKSLPGHTDGILSVVFSPDGKILASGSADATVNLWNADESWQMVRLTGHSSRVTSLAFSPKSNRLATGSYDGSVKLWDTSAQIWKEKQSLELITLRASGTVITLGFSPSNQTLMAGDGNGFLWLWRTDAERSHWLWRESETDDELLSSAQN